MGVMHFMKGVSTDIVKIYPKQIIQIRNILRDLGLNTSLKGTTLINKAVQMVLISNTDFIILKDIYQSIANYYNNLTITQIKMAIKYALDHRNEEKCIKNFEKIFRF